MVLTLTLLKMLHCKVALTQVRTSQLQLHYRTMYAQADQLH